jgi:iron complex transport system substrate-binding protein
MKCKVLLALLLVLPACTQREGSSEPKARVPKQIISVVPSATEMLFALGVGDRVIAVGDYDRFPPEVESKPRIGGLLNPNIEKIIEMKPDLVLTYGSQEALRLRLNAVGIRLYAFTHGDIEHTLDYIIELGKTVGEENRGREIVGRIHAAFDDLRKTAPAARPSVLVVHNRGAGLLGSFYSVGSKAFQHELIDIAGGRNVLGDLQQEVVQPTLEEILRRAPDIIIETIPPPASEADIRQRENDWKTLKNVPAVQKGRVFVVADDYLLVPGARLDQAARRFAELIRK